MTHDTYKIRHFETCTVKHQLQIEVAKTHFVVPGLLEARLPPRTEVSATEHFTCASCACRRQRKSWTGRIVTGLYPMSNLSNDRCRSNFVFSAPASPQHRVSGWRTLIVMSSAFSFLRMVSCGASWAQQFS